jgi:hypothetical protein
VRRSVRGCLDADRLLHLVLAQLTIDAKRARHRLCVILNRKWYDDSPAQCVNAIESSVYHVQHALIFVSIDIII